MTGTPSQVHINNFVKLAGRGDEEAVVEFLWQFGTAFINSKDTAGKTALIMASMNGQQKAVDQLLLKGAAPEACDFMGMVPLMYAAMGGHKEVAEALIGKGADVNYQDFGGRTALIIAAQYRQKAVTELLVSKGADLEARDNDEGATALDWAQMDDIHLHIRPINQDSREEIVAVLERAEKAEATQRAADVEQKKQEHEAEILKRLKEKRPPKPNFKKPQP